MDRINNISAVSEETMANAQESAGISQTEMAIVEDLLNHAATLKHLSDRLKANFTA